MSADAPAPLDIHATQATRIRGNSPTEPLLGSILDGRYRLLRCLGSGGMGTVYEAEHLVLMRRVAVKLVNAALTGDRIAQVRLQREAIAAAACRSEHIVEVFDMGRTPDGKLYLVLELLEGRTLRDVIYDAVPMPVERVITIGQQLCDALRVVHTAGIVHRDLKPENIFLTNQRDADFVKVLDFGVAKMLDVITNAPLTSFGTVVGTLPFLAPELFDDCRRVGPTVDIYALGVILYEMLARRMPHQAENAASLIRRICQDDPVALHTVRADVPQWLHALIHQMMARAPDGRPASIDEVLQALTQEAWPTAPRPRDDVPPAPPVEPDAPHKSHTPVLAAHASISTPPNATSLRRGSSTVPRVLLALAATGCVLAAVVRAQRSPARAFSHPTPPAVTRVELHDLAPRSDTSAATDPSAEMRPARDTPTARSPSPPHAARWRAAARVPPRPGPVSATRATDAPAAQHAPPTATTPPPPPVVRAPQRATILDPF